jgi:predicted phage terminase large subunit-like protein
MEIAKRVQPITNGDRKHLMFWLPPQHGKTLCVSKHFPAHLIERKPSNRIILGTYNYKFAADFSRAVKRILIDKNFSGFSGKQLANEWETSTNGFLKSFGMQSGITGTSADYVIIDDPIKSYAEAFSETIRDNIWNTFVYDIETREQKNTSYIIIQTRWHQDDLSGRLLDRDGRIEDGGKWDVLCLPALAEENDPLGRDVGEALCPSLHTKERLLERKKLEPSMFQALYQQSPTMDGGNIIKTEWFKYYNPDVINSFDYKIMSVDGAWETKKENDYSVCTTWGVIGNNYYLIDVWRDKVIYPTFKVSIRNIFNKYLPTTILVEDAASGKAFIQELSSCLPVHAIKPEGDKTVRIHAISDIIQSGRVFLPENHQMLYDFLHELSSFPKGKHDDICDTVSQAMRYLSNFSSSPISIF